jgi:hypothetical protein
VGSRKFDGMTFQELREFDFFAGVLRVILDVFEHQN